MEASHRVCTILKYRICTLYYYFHAIVDAMRPNAARMEFTLFLFYSNRTVTEMVLVKRLNDEIEVKKPITAVEVVSPGTVGVYVSLVICYHFLDRILN